jgi:hypothetical protein
MTDPLREFLNETIRSVVPKSWKVVIKENRNSIGIDTRLAKIGWGLSWDINDQHLKVACGNCSITVNLADPKSKKQLIRFFRWLTNWNPRPAPPKGLVIEHNEYEEE